MPRTKLEKVATKSTRAKVVKKTVIKTLRPKKRTRSILVDVIEDEPINSDSSWLAPEDKLETKNLEPLEEKNAVLETELASQKKQSANNETDTEIDRQKIFFEGLAAKIKNKGQESEKSEEGQKKYRSVGLYRRLVIKFIILVSILAVVVVYFSFSKLTVTINLKGETINDSLLLKVVDNSFSLASTSVDMASNSAATSATVSLIDQNDPRETVNGTIKEINTSVVKTYPANGETFIGNEIVGRVNIINNYNKDQALVATTRILSPDNKLYRIKEAVNVPAGGQVAVDIYADKPSAEMVSGVTTFTIPGLWAGLQDKIYAKNEAPFTFSQKIKKYVNSSDLAYAAQDINTTLVAAAKTKAAADNTLDPNVDWFYITNDPAIITINAKVGAEQSEFKAEATGKIVAVSFSKNEVARLAAAKLNLIIPDGKELTDFNAANIIYSLDSYDSVSRTATVKATFTGTMVLTGDSVVVNPAQLLNLTSDQIDSYLKNQPEISSYALKFFPSFIKRAPSLVDRIKIIISKN
ncbi:MAG: hypothetical protein WC249_01740 [Patescibacteria group bacterium]|jgi:hypothetical protein